MHEEHCKCKRLQGLMDDAVAAAEHNKVQNVKQKKTGAGVTVVQMDWIACKELHKDCH